MFARAPVAAHLAWDVEQSVVDHHDKLVYNGVPPVVRLHSDQTEWSH